MSNKTVPNAPFLKNIDRTHYKYCILELWNRQTTERKREINISLNMAGIMPTAFHKYRNITLNSSQDIPASKLEIIAVIFGVTPEFLKNYSFSKPNKNGYQVLQTRK